MRYLLPALFSFFLISIVSDEAFAKEQFVICKQSKFVRTIRSVVSDNSDQGCVAYYSRDGQEKIVGEGKFSETCKKIVGNVRTNLEAANWSCRDVTNSSFTGEAGN